MNFVKVSIILKSIINPFVFVKKVFLPLFMPEVYVYVLFRIILKRTIRVILN